MNSDSEGSYDSSSHSDNYSAYTTEGEFEAKLPRIRENDPLMTRLTVDGNFESVVNMPNDAWEQLGHDIANNTHLQTVCFIDFALNDHIASFLFRELTRSSSMKELTLQINELSAIGVRSMVPFLQNANNLKELDLTQNNLQLIGRVQFAI